MIEQLLKYQAVDKELKDIENSLMNSEERKKAVNAKKYLEGVNDSVNKLDDKASSLSAEYLNAIELQTKLNEQEKEIATALDNAKSESEITYLVKKAEELLSRIKSVAQTVTNLSNEIQAVLKEYSGIKAKTSAAKAQYNENGEKYNRLKASVADKKQAVEQQLEELKKQVDPKLMERYLAKRANKVYPVVYEVNGTVCGACNMELSMAEIGKLKNGEIIECDQCGRILYLPSGK